MRRVAGVVYLAVAAIPIRGACAQSQAVHVSPAVTVGMALPRDVPGRTTVGGHATASLDLSVGSPIEWRAEATYTYFATFDAPVNQQGVARGDLSGGVSLVLPIRVGGPSPYLVGGVEAHEITDRSSSICPDIVNVQSGATDAGSCTDWMTESNLRYGWSGGVGMDFVLNGQAYRVETRFTRVDAGRHPYEYVPISVGLRF